MSSREEEGEEEEFGDFQLVSKENEFASDEVSAERAQPSSTRYSPASVLENSELSVLPEAMSCDEAWGQNFTNSHVAFLFVSRCWSSNQDQDQVIPVPGRLR